MNASLASGTGIAAIRQLRDSPQKSTSRDIQTPITWGKEELKLYVARCGLQEIISVLASLQADGRMLPLLVDESMVKFAISDQYKRASFVSCMQAANQGEHDIASRWSVETTILWLHTLNISSFNSADDGRQFIGNSI